MNLAVGLTIVIVNWNSGVQLRRCLASIRQYGGSLVSRVVVVDNGSTDGSDVGLNALPGVTLIRAGCNLGFAAACNLGARDLESAYLLFLNPDAALQDQSLARALAFMEDPTHAQVGICGVKLVDETGHVARSCARFPTVASFVWHAVGVDRLAPRVGHMMAEWDHLQSRRVDHVIGAFFLVRGGLFRTLGGFDERFFVYLEDLDFSLRARQAGWYSQYLAEAQAFHAGGGTSRQVRARRLFYAVRSRILYAFKHFPVSGALLVMIASVLIEPCSRTLWALVRRSGSTAVENWRAYGMLLRWLPAWIARGQTR
jgi:GT2 family glycosyltransferase